jgi:HK97 family phage major capsid protein
MLALKRRRFEGLAKLRALLDTAELESRQLTHGERAEYTTREAEVERLGRDIRAAGGELDGRQAQPTGPAQQFDRSEGPGLGAEERMADVARERRGGDWGDDGEFRLGACIRAMATGDRSSLSDVERRALSEGSDAAGGFLIEESLSAQVIDKIRNKAQVIASGARTIPMPGDTLNVARMTGGSTANWKNENQTVTESDQVYDRVTFRTKTAVVLQKCSVELWEDLSDAATETIENEVLQALALKLDYAALRGSGSDPEPKGILNHTNVTLQSLGANGNVLAGYDDIATAVGTVAANNGQATGAIMAARTSTFLDKLKDSTGQPVQPPPSVRDLPFRTSNQIPVSLVQGSSGAVCSELYVADWSKVWIGVRPSIGIRIRLLQERYMDTLSYGIIGWIRADVQLSQPTHCVVITGIKP